MTRLPVVYIAGPFRADDHWQMYKHRFRALAAGIAVAEAGGVPLIPHTNTGDLHGTMTNDFWLVACQELLTRCDAAFFTAGWRDSEDARGEWEVAREMGIPAFDSMDELRDWINKVGPEAL